MNFYFYFQVAETIKTKHPETYEFFRHFPVEAEYIHDDPKDHYLTLDVPFKHHSITGEIEQFRYNVYDR